MRLEPSTNDVTIAHPRIRGCGTSKRRQSSRDQIIFVAWTSKPTRSRCLITTKYANAKPNAVNSVRPHPRSLQLCLAANKAHTSSLHSTRYSNPARALFYVSCVSIITLLKLRQDNSTRLARHVSLFRDSILVEDVWYLRHPLLSIDAIELALGRQISWLFQGAGHDITEVVLRSFSVLEDTTAASRAEFTMQ